MANETFGGSGGGNPYSHCILCGNAFMPYRFPSGKEAIVCTRCAKERMFGFKSTNAESQDLVDRNELLKSNSYGNAAPITHRTYAEQLIKCASSIPVKSEEHGRWMTGEEFAKEGYRFGTFKRNKNRHLCSECEEPALWEKNPYDYEFRECLSDVCPSCGAIMDIG